MPHCHRCGSPWESEKRVPGPKELCEQCNAYLHCCRNCKHHNLSAHNQCNIPNTEWVGDREGLNFCDEFEFRVGKPAEEDPAAKAAREKLKGILGDDAASSRQPRSLDDLFGP